MGYVNFLHILQKKIKYQYGILQNKKNILKKLQIIDIKNN